MATNQMRRDAAKRKLASQQARRAQQAARRRQIAVISSAAVVVIVLVAVVALSTIGRGGGDAPASAAPSDAANATSAAAQPAASGPGTCAYPSDGNAAKQNTPPPTEGVSSEGTVVGRAGHVGRSDRPHPEPRRGAVHGQQLRQPRRAGLLRRHRLPPPHHRRGPPGAAVRRPDRHRDRRPGLHDPGRGAHHPGRGAVRPRHRDLPARHRRHGQHRRSRTRAAASSSSSTPTRRCRRSTPSSARSTTPAWPRSTRSPPRARTTATARATASRRRRSRSDGRPTGRSLDTVGRSRTVDACARGSAPRGRHPVHVVDALDVAHRRSRWPRCFGSPISKENREIATRSLRRRTDADRMLTFSSASTLVMSDSSRCRSSASTWIATRNTDADDTRPTRRRPAAPPRLQRRRRWCSRCGARDTAPPG